MPHGAHDRTTHGTDGIDDLLVAWDAMSARYLPGRDDLVGELVGELRTRRAERVVDLGCGPATFMRRLIAELDPVSTIGIDDDPFLTELARRQLSSAGDRATIVERPLDDGWIDGVGGANSADAVVAMLVLHYFPADTWVRLLTDVHGVLRPGGLLAIVEVEADCGEPVGAESATAPTWNEWWTMARGIDDPELRRALTRRDARPTTPSAEHHPSLATLRGLLLDAGFLDRGRVRRSGHAYLLTARRPLSPG